MEVYKNVNNMKDGEILEVTASDPDFAKDIVSWCLLNPTNSTHFLGKGPGGWVSANATAAFKTLHGYFQPIV